MEIELIGLIAFCLLLVLAFIVPGGLTVNIGNINIGKGNGNDSKLDNNKD